MGFEQFPGRNLLAANQFYHGAGGKVVEGGHGGWQISLAASWRRHRLSGLPRNSLPGILGGACASALRLGAGLILRFSARGSVFYPAQD
jgi:hypothetical protein